MDDASTGTKTMQINLDDVESGVYFCNIKMNEKMQHVKMVKE